MGEWPHAQQVTTYQHRATTATGLVCRLRFTTGDALQKLRHGVFSPAPKDCVFDAGLDKRGRISPPLSFSFNPKTTMSARKSKPARPAKAKRKRIRTAVTTPTAD